MMKIWRHLDIVALIVMASNTPYQIDAIEPQIEE